MKLVYQLRHMYPIRLENSYLYHLSDMGTRPVLLRVLLVPFHLRPPGKGIRLFLMLELSRFCIYRSNDMDGYVLLRVSVCMDRRYQLRPDLSTRKLPAVGTQTPCLAQVTGPLLQHRELFSGKMSER